MDHKEVGKLVEYLIKNKQLLNYFKFLVANERDYQHESLSRDRLVPYQLANKNKQNLEKLISLNLVFSVLEDFEIDFTGLTSDYLDDAEMLFAGYKISDLGKKVYKEILRAAEASLVERRAIYKL